MTNKQNTDLMSQILKRPRITDGKTPHKQLCALLSSDSHTNFKLNLESQNNPAVYGDLHNAPPRPKGYKKEMCGSF